MDQVRIGNDGQFRLPRIIMDALGLQPGSYVTFEISGEKVILRKTTHDPFEQPQKGPNLGALENIAKKQEEASKRANRAFEKLMENPPEVRPEDKPDFWD